MILTTSQRANSCSSRWSSSHFLTVLLRYILCIIKFIYFKFTNQWHLITSLNGATIIMSQFQNIVTSPCEDPSCPLRVKPHSTSSPRKPLIYFLILTNLPFETLHIKRIIQIWSRVWIISLSIALLRFTHDIACVTISFLFIDELYSIIWRPYFAYLFSSGLSFRLSPLFDYYE